MRVQWQVRYLERCVEHWWDYPRDVNEELEEIKDDIHGDVWVEWTNQYPAKRSGKKPSGTFHLPNVEGDNEDEFPRVDATYRFYPKTKVQVNIADCLNREKTMRRVIID